MDSQIIEHPPAIDAEDLRVLRVRALRGPNYWRLAPVIACDVTLGGLESIPSCDIPGFADRLIAAVPTLHEHPCSRGAEGGFVARLQEGTQLPHILEHVALELQTLAGSDADEMHPDNVTACEMAAAVVGLDIAGIDVLTQDVSDQT